MLYAALTFWLLVAVFSAWGVHSLWSSMIKPRVVNSILLPGTLVAQLGHVLGLLITGNAVQNTTLMSDDDEGKPQSDAPERTRIPVLGPILIGLLPLVACAACLYVAARFFGDGVLGEISGGAALTVPPELPTTLAGTWALLRESINLVEQLVSAVVRSDWMSWKTALFLYLAVCLTVRMAPFEGNRRGALGAIVLTGLVVGVIATLTLSARQLVLSSWPILSFAVGVLLFLLLLSLAVKGGVELGRILIRNE